MDALANTPTKNRFLARSQTNQYRLSLSLGLAVSGIYRVLCVSRNKSLSFVSFDLFLYLADFFHSLQPQQHLASNHLLCI